MSQPNAQASYCETHLAIQAKLDAIRERMFDYPAPDGDVLLNWSHVGDLVAINHKLAEVLAFIEGEN